jgi:lysophospholipase L1-like esterase
MWGTAASWSIAAFLSTLVLLIATRARAYRQTFPWLAGSFAAAAALAMVVLFFGWHTVWFAAATGTGCLALVCALILRRKPLSVPVSRADVFALAAVAASGVLALAATELVLRLMPGVVGDLGRVIDADPAKYGVPHPYIGYLHRPNGATVVSGSDFSAVHTVDARGFRNAWPWPASPDVVVIGDSVTFGYGASGEEAWPAIVARGLPDHPLVNLALIGAGPQQYLRVYETFGVELRPKLLLVGVFASNDFWDAEAFDQWLQSGAGGNYMVWRDFGRPGPSAATGADWSFGSLIEAYGYSALRATRTYNLLRALRREVVRGLIAPTAQLEFGDGGRLRLLSGDFRSKSTMASRDTRTFRLTLDALERIHALARERGTRVLMVLQPSKEEVYLPLIEEDVPDLATDLRRSFEERGIEYLDLGPAFRARAAAGERLFFETDGHPNPAGYALVARLVLSHLIEHGPRYGLDDVPAAVTLTGSVAEAPRHR